ncbi:ccr4 associated factor [Recurvomyces mirabilis]|uniref:Iron-sulfur cluster assembly factor IBA57 homolog, mitochondrial n=1 Tax=Recurvomyces mirabilis TaxID=574656 RepID=A0AAE1C6L1_9PEZI|nr:ccr4 associated factor [Recurvomyces mirabilis]KAK5162123.1 ccr4 associated factor [Recurvomyces mirabilis]
MPVRSTRAPWTCAQCLLKQKARRALLRRSISTSAAPPLPPASGAAHLTTRRLISLHGPDSPKFLQGLITNNVLTPPARQGSFYAAFLTGQGRVVVDVFVYPTQGSRWHGQAYGDGEPGYLVEVDANELEVLAKHIKKHKLRSKFKMRVLEEGEMGLWSSWREEGRWTAHPSQDSNQSISEEGYLSATDARAPGMGTRLLLPSSSQSGSGLPAELELEEAPLSAYTIRRYLRGVPEGQREFAREESLPMNFNVDLMGGIDFKKGCYTGQELTVRTHHTGVVRRRVLPVVLQSRGEEGGADLVYDSSAAELIDSVLGHEGAGLGEGEIRRDDQRKRPTGKLIARTGNVGLGLCRLEQMSDLSISGEGSSFGPEDRFMVQAKEGDGAVAVKAFVPDWIRGRLRGPKVQKRVEM